MAVSLYKPTHRADVSALIPPSVDPSSDARCIATPGHVGICPRHNPKEYADSMARHAADSL